MFGALLTICVTVAACGGTASESVDPTATPTDIEDVVASPTPVNQSTLVATATTVSTPPASVTSVVPAPASPTATTTAAPEPTVQPSPSAEAPPSPTPTEVTSTPVASTATPVPTVSAVVIGNARFTVEVAGDPRSRATGLSGRESLPEDAGMLFIWESGVATSFWMAGMLIPLDILWISAECTVTDIDENALVPESGALVQDLPIHAPVAPSAYGLEVNAGRASEFGIVIGDSVRFENVDTPEGQGCPR